MIEKYLGGFLYFLKTQFRKYKRICINARYSILLICALFVFLRFNVEVNRFQWLFWTPPNYASTITKTGKIEKIINDTNKIPRLKINVDNGRENIFIDCEPQPYLNQCLDNKAFNVFDNRAYEITYVEYASNNDYGIEKILLGLSYEGKSILTKEQRIKEISSEPIIKKGTKNNYKFIRVSGDKNSMLFSYILMGIGIIFTLLIVVIPLIIKITWDINNNIKKLN